MGDGVVTFSGRSLCAPHFHSALLNLNPEPLVPEPSRCPFGVQAVAEGAAVLPAVAALDQHLTYRQLKTIDRNSLEYAFIPGASLWTTVGTPVDACAATDTMAVGDSPNATCAAFLATSQRATLQWDLEGRFLAFERQQ